MRRSVRALAAGLVCAACGGKTASSGKPAQVLDCTWLTGPNCWQAILPSVDSCVAASSATGTFSPDRTTCTYADGTVVSFASPVPMDPSSYLFDFTVSHAGATCLTVEQPSGLQMSLTSAGGTISYFETTSTTGDYGVTCPDGTRFENRGVPPACPAFFPGIATNALGTQVQLELTGAGIVPTTIFACQ
jgi:hypothetical protein